MSPKKDFAAMEARGGAGGASARDALRRRLAHPTNLPLDELQGNPLNPRDGDDPDVAELAATLARVGQLQPAIVVARNEYLSRYPDQALGPQPWVVIVGNRRLAAARLAGRPSLDVRVAPDLATAQDLDDLILIENIHRKSLSPLREAEHLQRRLDRPGESLRTVAEAIGKSHTYVKQRVGLLNLLPEFKDLLRADKLPIKTARLLGTLPEDEQQERLAAGEPFLSPAPAPAASSPVLDDRSESGAGNQVSSAAPASTSSRPGAAGQAESSENEELRSPDRVRSASAPAPGSATSPHGNPVSTAAGPSGACAPLGEPTTSKEKPAPGQLEQAAEAITLHLHNALTEADRVLPHGGAGQLADAIVEAHRHIAAALQLVQLPSHS
jgi:ParB family chromosome partitioning protein